MSAAPPPPADFDPRDPPLPRSDNPLAAYLSIPNGIGGIASILILLALLFVYTAAREFAMHAPQRVIVSLLAPGALFGVIGVGFWQCRAWGWWLIGVVFWFLLVNSTARIGRVLVGRPDPQATFLWIATVAEIAVLLYIHRPAVVRHMRFRRPPAAWLRWSPGVIGVAVGALAVWRMATVAAT